MRKWRALLVSIFVAWLLAGCGPAEPEIVTVPDGAAAGNLTALEPCEFQPGKGKTYDAECGTLVVRERWEDSGSRLIALPVVRIPATEPDPTEPIFWLQGGPGASNLSFAPPDWLLENHDVIEVGYRGVEGSVQLACPEVDTLANSYLGKGIFGDEARAALVTAVRQCAETHRAAGVDLGGYTVGGVIADMEAARVALGYDRINLYGASYGTRVAQLYAYLHPDSLHRVVMIGLNTPGHFVYDRAVFNDMLHHMRDLCAQDPDCSRRTDDLAQTIYDVNRTMPNRWFLFPIDPGTVRLGAHMMFFATPNMPTALDMYLAAGDGDASGLAMMTLMAKYVFPPFVYGDLFNKGGTLDLEYYRGPDSVNLGDSILGAPLAELIWPMAEEWPVELEDAALRRLQESDVDMLVVNGDLDFSTPPNAIDKARPYWREAQFVLLPGFSHVDDVETLQPEAFARLITSYYDTGTADPSLFTPQPLQFKPGMSLAVMAKLLAAAVVIVPLLLIGSVTLIIRRVRR